MQREKTPEWREKQKSSRGIRRGQRYRLVFQFPIREQPQQPQQPQQSVSPAINDKKSDSGVNVPAGGIEQELKMKPEEDMEQQLPPGISESGEVVDMAAYEAWQQENHPDTQQQMQRREEVNINVHRERGEDVEPGDDF
ncbi:conjugal transfer protein TraD [Escherichia coli]|nr:conjugal transfer protein TraD [Escherichia coli]